jgi:hypothetical protein
LSPNIGYCFLASTLDSLSRVKLESRVKANRE